MARISIQQSVIKYITCTSQAFGVCMPSGWVMENSGILLLSVVMGAAKGIGIGFMMRRNIMMRKGITGA